MLWAEVPDILFQKDNVTKSLDRVENLSYSPF